MKCTAADVLSPASHDAFALSSNSGSFGWPSIFAVLAPICFSDSIGW